MPGRKREKRYDANGVIESMAYADGFVMVRRPGSSPWVITEAQFDYMSRDPNVETKSRG